MDGPKQEPSEVAGRQLIVKADEVDQVGTTIQSPSEQLPLSALEERTFTVTPARKATQTQPKRPILRRDGSAPVPPAQSPPPAPSAAISVQQTPDSNNPSDSLSLAQLKQIVNHFPKTEQRAYAFHYADAQPFTEEVEEWFQYSEQDRTMISNAKDTFERNWRSSFSDLQKDLPKDDLSWIDVGDRVRKNILTSVLFTLDHPDRCSRIQSLEVVFYVLGGIWGITAGLGERETPQNQHSSESTDKHHNSVQIEWMHRGADLLLECSGLQKLQDCTLKAFSRDDIDVEYGDELSHDPEKQANGDFDEEGEDEDEDEQEGTAEGKEERRNGGDEVEDMKEDNDRMSVSLTFVPYVG
jgi:hypothetical protein